MDLGPLIIVFFIFLIIVVINCPSRENLTNVPTFDPKVLTNEYRIGYYCKLDKQVDIDLEELYPLEKDSFLVDNNFLYFDPDPENKNKYYKDYIYEMRKYYYSLGTTRPVYFLFGDVHHESKYPAVSKTRPRGSQRNVLLKLNRYRHWTEPLNQVELYDIPYDQKKDKVLWRGFSRGLKQRIDLLKRYKNHPNRNIDITDTETETSMSIQDMLQCKFLVSVKGNDVATNLKWIMYSNSLCMMPSEHPYVSWFMEDLLVPWYHYVPLESDFSDLEEKYQWCLSNPDRCKEIIKNASDYIEVFLDGENEDYLNTVVLEKYTQLVNIS